MNKDMDAFRWIDRARRRRIKCTWDAEDPIEICFDEFADSLSLQEVVLKGTERTRY